MRRLRLGRRPARATILAAIAASALALLTTTGARAGDQTAELSGVERVVARIYDPRRAKIFERLGIPTIATVEWATERVLQRIMPDRPNAEWIDPSAKVLLIERPIPSVWAGRKLGELDVGGHARVAAVTRLGEGSVAGPDTILQDGDVIHAMVSGDSLETFDRHLGTGPAKGGH